MFAYTAFVGSKTFEGVFFAIYSHDHAPPHAHARYGSVRVIVELTIDGGVQLADRWDAVLPPNGKRGDVRHILAVAEAYAAELNTLWRLTHGD